MTKNILLFLCLNIFSITPLFSMQPYDSDDEDRIVSSRSQSVSPRPQIAYSADLEQTEYFTENQLSVAEEFLEALQTLNYNRLRCMFESSQIHAQTKLKNLPENLSVISVAQSILNRNIPALTRILLSSGWNPLDRDRVSNMTGIDHAFINGNLETITQLLSAVDSFTRKSLINRRIDSWGNTLLHLAVLQENLNLIERLIKIGANSSTLNSAGQSAMDLAIASGNIRLVQLIVRSGRSLPRSSYFSLAS